MKMKIEREEKRETIEALINSISSLNINQNNNDNKKLIANKSEIPSNDEKNPNSELLNKNINIDNERLENEEKKSITSERINDDNKNVNEHDVAESKEQEDDNESDDENESDTTEEIKTQENENDTDKDEKDVPKILDNGSPEEDTKIDLNKVNVDDKKENNDGKTDSSGETVKKKTYISRGLCNVSNDIYFESGFGNSSINQIVPNSYHNNEYNQNLQDQHYQVNNYQTGNYQYYDQNTDQSYPNQNTDNFIDNKFNFRPITTDQNSQYNPTIDSYQNGFNQYPNQYQNYRPEPNNRNMGSQPVFDPCDGGPQGFNMYNSTYNTNDTNQIFNSMNSPNYPPSPGNSSNYSPVRNKDFTSPASFSGGSNSNSPDLSPSSYQGISPNYVYHPDDSNHLSDSESVFQAIKEATENKEECKNMFVPSYDHILNELNSSNFDEYDFNDIDTDGSWAAERLEQQLILTSDGKYQDRIDLSSVGNEIPKFRVEKINPSSSTTAKVAIKKLCNEPDFSRAVSHIAPQTNEALCTQDEDGDSFLMICVSKPSTGRCFYENLYALTERLKQINMCCNQVVSSSSCSVCGNSDKRNYSTPLSLKNNAGDTALSCAIKVNQPEEVIEYLCDSIKNSQNDLQTVFDEAGKAFFHEHIYNYNSLALYL